MRREMTDGMEPLEEAILQILRKAKRHPMPFKNLQKEVAKKIESCRTPRVLSVLDRLVAGGAVMVVGKSVESEYFRTANLDYLKGRLCAILRSHHTKFPYEPGMRAGDIRKLFSETQTMNAKVNIDARLFELAMSACKNDGLVVEAGYGVRLSEFTPQSSEDREIRRLGNEILSYISVRCHSRVGIGELSSQLAAEPRMVKAVVSEMLKSKRLIRIEENRYLEPSVIEHLKYVLAAEFSSNPRLRISDITVLLGQSRTATIPLLEYFDRIGFTRREGDHRQMAARSMPHC
jgi:hypothetical protein